VERKILAAPEVLGPAGDFALVTVVDGAASCGGSYFATGDFFLLPASGAPAVAPAADRCAVLVTTIP
jgi:hypothetical protein